MAIFGAIVCLAFFFLVVFDFEQHLPPERQRKFRLWFLMWAGKGVLAPVLLWILFDAGIFDCFPTFTPFVEDARSAGHWFAAVVDVAAMGIFVIGTYWAGITSAWLLVALSERTENRAAFNRCALLWSAILAPVAVLMTHLLGWKCAGAGATLWFLPIVQRTLGLQPEEITRPMYSLAIAKLKFDKHEEAEAAVLAELEKCEEDFDGWLMLADLYANHFQDLPGAEEIIHQTCDHPGTTASQAAVAYHRLADWHLKLASDPSAARLALMEICRRHPKSHLERMARLRIEQLPASKEELIAQTTGKPVPLPERIQPDCATQSAGLIRNRAEALARAQYCALRLQKDPNDVAAREDLARIYAEHLDAVDAGLEQLELLLSMPDPPDNKAAQWLSYMAGWHLKHKQNTVEARKILERIIRLYPKTSHGFGAQSQLNLMDAEARLRQRNVKPKIPPA